MTEERQKRELPARHSFLTDFVSAALDAQSKPQVPQIDSSTLIKITTSISHCIDNGDPEPIALPSEEITPIFRVLPRRPPARNSHSSPITEEFYHIRHKKHEMEEKKQKNREKEKLEHDLYQQLQLVDKLKTIDKSTLASIVNSLRHQRNNPQLIIDLDQLQSTLLQEAREQLHRYEQLGLGRKKGQGITPIKQSINHQLQQQEQHQQQEQEQQQEQQEQNINYMDDELPYTYETLLPLIITPSLPTPPTPPTLPRTENKKKKKNIVKVKDTEISVVNNNDKNNNNNKIESIVVEVEINEDIDVNEKEINNKKVNPIISDKEPLISKPSISIKSNENSISTSTSLSSSTIHTTTITQTNHHETNKTTTINQPDLTNEKRHTRSKSLSSSSSSSSTKNTSSKKNENKKLRDEKVLNYFKSSGSLVTGKGQRRSMRTVTVFGDKLPFFDTVEFTLPLDQFGDLVKKKT